MRTSTSDSLISEVDLRITNALFIPHRRTFRCSAGHEGPVLEVLERRRLCTIALVAGTLMISGTNDSENLYVENHATDASKVTASDGTIVRDYDKEAIFGIEINGFGGDDLIGVDGIVWNVPATLNGGDGEDDITGGEGPNTISGGAQADVISGGGMADQIDGNGGNDAIHGLDGDDHIYGGADNDTIFGEGDEDWITGDGGADSLFGGDEHDVIFGGDGDDAIAGNAGPDVLYGDGGNDHIDGGTGADEMHGGDNADWLVPGDWLEGDSFFDVMFGEGGDDGFWGGEGAQQMDGGEGNDYFMGMNDEFADDVTGGPGDDSVEEKDVFDSIANDVENVPQ